MDDGDDEASGGRRNRGRMAKVSSSINIAASEKIRRRIFLDLIVGGRW